ncbi:hypothetical protein ACFVVL_26175 [Kitasatospora sp. NPDC058115]|uniref:hypothetical protein n=1 Tax=Kitasatospora sp. NPDC058115 TaxID=3346347 RepID=UPI0036DBABFE
MDAPGLQQTAMNTGPAIGVAPAGPPTAGHTPLGALPSALAVLAATAAAGALLATRLPAARTA